MKDKDVFYADMKLQSFDTIRKQLAPHPLSVPEGCVGFILVYKHPDLCSGKYQILQIDEQDAAREAE